jgi:hypothetical protein
MDRQSQDLFQPIVLEFRLDPRFRRVAREPGFAPARATMREVFAEMGDRDGNFVEQFQTEGFDARVWELYLYAAFTSVGYVVDSSYDAPDFLLRRHGLEWAVEATTANPTAGLSGVAPSGPEGIRDYLEDDLPIKLGSPLLSKLRKRYWEQPHVADQPLVLALQSFATDDALTYSDYALTNLLFGVHTYGERQPDGSLRVLNRPIKEHRGIKTIPSGFFQQPDAEHLSAVLWSNSGTVPKFARVGFQQGLDSAGISMVRRGLRYVMNPDASEPAPFEYEVGSRWETWAEGLVMIHNPYALLPLPYEALPEAVHHELENGVVVSTLPPFHAFASLTEIRQRRLGG